MMFAFIVALLALVRVQAFSPVGLVRSTGMKVNFLKDLWIFIK
jgi:hypothetical protein